MIGLIFNLALLAVAAWVGVTVYMQYRSATGSTWERLLVAGRGSATIVWQKVGIFTGALLAGATQLIDWIAPFVADETTAEQIKGYLQSAMKPQFVGAALVAFALVGVFARLRTLKA